VTKDITQSRKDWGINSITNRLYDNIKNKKVKGKMKKGENKNE